MFYKGIVEDNLDNKYMGRVKVRIIGKHTSNESKTPSENLPTSDLPWASPIFPCGVSTISDVCDFVVPVINSIVICGYFDKDEQELFYIGSIGLFGKNKLQGFGNKKSENPKKEYPFNDLVKSNTDIYENELTTNVLFSEPDPEHNTVYPNNRVICTKSGHVIELDDSDGSERIRIRHKIGSFEEYHKNGTNVEKLIKDKYIINENLNIHTEVNFNLYTNGIINVYCENDINVRSIGDTNITVDGNTNLECIENISINAGGEIAVTAGDNITMTAPTINLN